MSRTTVRYAHDDGPSGDDGVATEDRYAHDDGQPPEGGAACGPRSAFLTLQALLLITTVASSAPVGTVREILVPYEQLHVLLESDADRVLMPREEYEELLAKSRKQEDADPPLGAISATATYHIAVEQDRAVIAGTIGIDVLRDGLQSVPLAFGGVGVRSAQLDGENAPLGRAGAGQLTLFIEGKGQHTLTVEAVTPLHTSAARQTLVFRLPVSPATEMDVTVPGDVQMHSGAPVASRVFDEKAVETRFELLPTAGDVSLVMSLNSRLKRKDRVVVARSVIVDEVTQAYERLHATVSCDVLHRAVDTFRFAVPVGFEVTDVTAPGLTRWAMEDDNERRVLAVFLREGSTGKVVLSMSAVHTSPRLDDWSLPRFEPLDVVGDVAVVGLVLEDRLDVRDVDARGLIPVDNDVLQSAMPTTVTAPDPGRSPIRTVLAYFARSGDFSLRAGFHKPAAELRVTTNVLLTIGRSGLTAQAGVSMLAEHESHFALNVDVPAGWDVTRVRRRNGEEVPFERYDLADGPSRLHIRLAHGVAPAQEHSVLLDASYVPTGWLDEWEERAVTFPVFAVRGAVRDIGAVAVGTEDDLRVRPARLSGLMPLNETEKNKYGLGGVATALAYRYDAPPYAADLAVDHVTPRLTAETLSFFRIERDVVACRYELAYTVEQARARELSLLLPAETPESLSVTGIGGTEIKEYVSEEAGEWRRWTVRLADASAGVVRLAVDFQQPLQGQSTRTLRTAGAGEARSVSLPMPRADGVDYQSGLLAVEGSAELDVRILEHPRKVDIGELVDAEYQPGARLLGAYGFVGEPPEITVSVKRPDVCPLPPAIAQRAEIATLLSADGVSQTSARFLLHTKSLFLEIELPEAAVLWAVTLDGKPARPQRQGESILVDLPAGDEGQLRDLRMVYECPTEALGLLTDVRMAAPRLTLHGNRDDAGYDVPLVDAVWRLYLPTGHRVVGTDGTMIARSLRPPRLAVVELPRLLYQAGGGIRLGRGWLSAAVRNPMPIIVFLAALGILTVVFLYGRNRVRKGRSPFGVLAEMLVVFSILVVLAGMLMPALSQSREKARRISCAGNLKQIGLACRMFSSDNEGRFPDSLVPLAEQGYLDANKVYGCPSKTNPSPSAGNSDYVYVGAGLTEANDNLTQTILAYCSHHGFFSILFADGHVKGAVADSIEIAAQEHGWLLPGSPPAQQAVQVAATSSGRHTDAPDDKATSRGKKPRATWALEGVRSLTIRILGLGESVYFQGLGEEPSLSVSLANERRTQALAWTVAAAVSMVGVALTRSGTRAKATYIIGVLLVSTVAAVPNGMLLLAPVLNAAFYAACLLAPFYLIARTVLSIVADFQRGGTLSLKASAAGSAVALVALAISISEANAQQVPLSAGSVQPPTLYCVEEPLEPVDVPKDAVIVPYRVDQEGAIEQTDTVLVPGDAFQGLWTATHPQTDRDRPRPPVAYAIAGLTLTGTLDNDDFLRLKGQLDIDVFVDGFADVPLPLEGAVLASARVDGASARLRTVGIDLRSVTNAPAQQMAPRKAVTFLTVSGRGRHRVELALRMKLERRGGWRVARGLLPAAPASAVELLVPQKGTEVQLSHVRDRTIYKPKTDGETIRTALAEDGRFGVQWCPEIAEGQIDRTLTVESEVSFDILEDALRLAAVLTFDLRRGERDSFAVELPDGYLVEKVDGTNVRGWRVGEGAAANRLDVEMLKPSKERETFGVHLWQPWTVVDEDRQEVSVPQVTVPGASRHVGRLTVRRSPALDVRVLEQSNVSRVDVEATSDTATPEAPLGIRPFQACRFVAVPFVLRMSVGATAPDVSADVRTILRIAERERTIETHVVLAVRGRPLHQIAFLVPADLDIDTLTMPGTFEWGVTEHDGRQRVMIHLASGLQGDVPVVLGGRLGAVGAVTEVPIPRVEAMGAEHREGTVVVQADPAYDVRTVDLAGIEIALLKSTHGWLSGGQRELSRLALRHDRPEFSGRLVLEPRKADVRCHTVSNVRVTDRTIEETTLVDFTILNAGIQHIELLLPGYLRDARISVPLLRQKQIEDADDGHVLVTLELQDQVMNQLRVLVEHDRLLSDAEQTLALPVVRTGRTDRRYAAIESAGRDEVLVMPGEDFEPLSRHQKEWQAVANSLSGGATQAFIARQGAAKPALTFRTEQRKAVETVGARIGLAQTVLVMDSSGTFRASQVFHVNNRTEQFLDIAMPEGTALWSARVAGQLVKPSLPTDAEDRIHIPLVKTAAGDLDYTVVLKYGGRIRTFGSIRSMDFPMVRTLNINVEQSQVELRLPLTHEWFQFDGTMRQVLQAGDFEAGMLAYQTKLAKRLVQTLKFGSDFEKARAYSNLKQIGWSLKQSREKASTGYDRGNTFLEEQVSESRKVLEDVQKELVANEAELQVTFSSDNRARLNTVFAGQSNDFAKNKAQTVAPNWDAATVQRDAKVQTWDDFNGAWLGGNALVEGGQGMQPENDQGMVELKIELPKAQFIGTPQSFRRGRKDMPKPKAEPGFVQVGEQAGEAAQVEQAQKGKSTQQRGRQFQLARYQEKLEQRAAEQQDGQMLIAQVNQLQPEERDGEATTPLAAAPHEAAVSTGLVSLDFDLPLPDPERWETVKFTTPRGEVRITARSASTRRLAGAKRLGAAAFVLLLVLGLRAASTRRALPELSSRGLAKGAIVVGLAGLLLGVFPVYAILALVGGMFGMIVRRTHQPEPSKA